MGDVELLSSSPLHYRLDGLQLSRALHLGMLTIVSPRGFVFSLASASFSYFSFSLSLYRYCWIVHRHSVGLKTAYTAYYGIMGTTDDGFYGIPSSRFFFSLFHYSVTTLYHYGIFCCIYSARCICLRFQIYISGPPHPWRGHFYLLRSCTTMVTSYVCDLHLHCIWAAGGFSFLHGVERGVRSASLDIHT